MRPAVLLLAISLPVAAAAEQSGTDMTTVRRAVTMLADLGSQPSESADRQGVERAASWLERRFRELGFSTQRIEPGPSSNPILFAELPPGGATAARKAPVVLFYMHFDTQPTGPSADWASTGGSPFSPRLLSGRWDDPASRPLEAAALQAADLAGARLYGRGVADDKAPIVMHLLALEGWAGLREPSRRGVHIKYLLDGEEEAGSPGMADALARHADRLRADILFLCDGPMDALGRPSVYLGTRGDMHARLRVKTAASPAHSGNYGLLPNAAWRMASLLATMKALDGQVTVEGFEEDVVPPTAEEREAMAAASAVEPVIAKELGTASFEGEGGRPYYERLLFHPSLIINHMISGRPGNQIPVVAEAILEIRLVSRQDPHKVFETVRRHVARHAPEAELTYLDGTPAARMDRNDPMVARGIEAVRAAMGSDVLVLPSLGGTLPLLGAFGEAGHRYIGLPLVNYDNNQHVGNENVAVSALARGIPWLRRLYDELARPKAATSR